MTLLRRKYDRNYFESSLYRPRVRSQRNRRRLREVRRWIRGGRLLEIGCATGEFLALATNHFEVKGVDVSQHALDRVPSELETKVEQLDAEHSALPAGPFDAVVAFNVLEHMKAPQVAARKVHQVLRPGGVLVGSVPHNAGLVGRIYTLLSNLADATHQSTLSPRRWRKVFKSAGFAMVRFLGEVPFTPHFGWYIDGRYREQVSANLIFVCQKV